MENLKANMHLVSPPPLLLACLPAYGIFRLWASQSREPNPRSRRSLNGHPQPWRSDFVRSRSPWPYPNLNTYKGLFSGVSTVGCCLGLPLGFPQTLFRLKTIKKRIKLGSVYFEVFTSWPCGNVAANKILVYFYSWQCGRLAPNAFLKKIFQI